MSSSTQQVKKPIQLRIIFILNALMMLLPFLFYAIISIRGASITGLEPSWIAFTGVAYIVSFIVLVYSILKKKFMLFRIMFIINILIALPTRAYIGIGVAIISIALSFHNKIKEYFLQ